MGLDSGKHSEKEINEVRCRVVETGIEKPRADFLKELLELNGFEVHIGELPIKVEGDPQTYILGVTDITLNPVLAVYAHKLKTADGRLVTPAYWNQLTDETVQEYWTHGRDKES
jgi:hypothetical protein